MSFRLIDLFAGAGGFTQGFAQIKRNGEAAFNSVWANDFNADAVKTYNANFGEHCTHGDIIGLLDDPMTHIPRADIVIGGPPCQGFSPLNKNRELDPRKQMWIPFMDVVKRCGASVFVMENVPELLTSAEFGQLEEHAFKLGFTIRFAKLIAADYGVPQTRTRAFVFGSRLHDPIDVFPPKRTHYNPRKPLTPGMYVANPQPWVTVREAIEDLAEPVGTELRGDTGTEALHFGRNPTQLSLDRYRAIPDPGMNRVDLLRLAPELTPACWVKKKSGGTDLFGRLWWDRPSVTIRTEFYKPEKGRYLHPEAHRPITHREAARFQSFPDTFIFKGTKVEVARQIGNAVAPKLAEKIAQAVFDHIQNDKRIRRAARTAANQEAVTA